MFGLLGARVTVVDISQGQLHADREAAAHHGYDVTTVHADMRDLSSLQPESIDLVYGMTPCWSPDIRAVYAQVSRVLRVGGLYRTDVGQPGLHFVEWDGSGYRIAKPYCERLGPYDADGGAETRHYMDDIFGGLIDAGLSLVQVTDEARWRQVPDAPPGSYHHLRAWVGGGFEIIARKAVA